MRRTQAGGTGRSHMAFFSAFSPEQKQPSEEAEAAQAAELEVRRAGRGVAGQVPMRPRCRPQSLGPSPPESQARQKHLVAPQRHQDRH